MNIRFLLLFLTITTAAGLHVPLKAQCPLTVDAGPDQVVCDPGNQATLSGSVTGNALGFGWTPAAGLSDPASLTPAATVTGTATYTLTAQAFDPNAPNLLTNGDFESGNTGFNSSYTFNAMPLTPGLYTITTSPQLVWASFPPCDDHTFGNGTGNMMLVNGAGIPGAGIWCQTVTVTPNTWYVMSFWVITSPISPAQLQFAVNGMPLGNVFQATPGLCVWEQFSTAWFSGAAASATICILSQNAGNGTLGDDFALDDISLSAACSVSDQVTVSIAEADAVAPATLVLPCNASQTGIQLDGSASSSGPNISYLWSGPGILSGGNTSTATVNAEGSYTLTVTYDDGQTICTDEATVNVLPDPNIVLANVALPDELNCNNTSLTLDGSASSSGPTISYDWAFVPGPGGSPPGIVSGGTTVNPVVDQPGVYTLTVSNSISGCTATASVVVTQDVAPPSASATAPDTLDCFTPTVTLSGAGSSTGFPFTYLWQTADGNIVSGATTLNNCVANAPGTYSLTVTNPDNGCTATATAELFQNGIVPSATIAPPDTLDCETPSLTLDGSASSAGPGFTFTWTTANGNITGGTNTLTPTVDAAGDYVLTVSNTANGCSASDTVSVSGDANLPVAEAGPGGMLDCNTATLTLDGGGSSAGADFTYAWTTSAGNILNGETTLSPEVDAAGTYVLTVTNLANGCEISDSTTVSLDTLPPNVVIATPGTLDCETTSLVLDGSLSSAGANFSHLWTTSDGNIVNGEMTFTPVVDAPGSYTFTITNTANACIASATVTVVENTTPPVAEAGDPATLTCAQPTATLDGSASSQGGNFIYQWTFVPPAGGGTGGIVSGATTLMPEVDENGMYFLTVTDTLNGCTAVDSVAVGLFAGFPSVQVAPADTLTCTQQQLTLSATASQGAIFSYLWTTPDGNIVSGATTLSPVVNAPGAYLLTVTNTQNGCSATDAVQVAQNAVGPVADAGPPFQLSCSVSQATLDGSGSSAGPGFSYFWSTTNGNIVSSPTLINPVINAPGTYTLTVTNAANGCMASDLVVVSQDAAAPIADAGSTSTISCTQTSVTLDGTGSSSGPGITYLWTTQDGSIVSGATTLNPVVDAPGTYLLAVTNTQNNCQTLASVMVMDFTQPPNVNGGAPVVLTCSDTVVALNGSASGGGQLAWLWTTANGNIVSGATTPAPLIDAPGTYSVTVTNQQNGCTATATATATENLSPPVAAVAAPAVLGCILTQIQLNAGGSSTGANFTYAWTTQDGNLVSGETTTMPLVDAPGTYLLTVTSQQNGCTATASATVVGDNTPPVAEAGTAPSFGCSGGSLLLDGSGSSAGANFTYAWTTQDGSFVSGETTLSPEIDAPGTYLLTVTNQQNGCTATDSVTVTDDGGPPVAAIAPPGELNCVSTQLTLDATASSGGPNFTYAWTTQDGSLLSGDTTATPVIDATGTYLLTVTNSANGCTATATVGVAENTVPPGASIEADTITCQEPEVALFGSSPTFNVTWQWTTVDGSFIFGETTPTPGVDAPGVYILTVTNPANGCTSVAEATVVAVVLEDFSFEIINPDCVTGEGSVTFTNVQGGTPPYRYSVDGGLNFETEPVFENLPPGIYELEVRDAAGCRLTATAELAAPPAIEITLEPQITVGLGDSRQLEPQLNVAPTSLAEIVWSPAEGLDCTDCLRPILTPTADGVYTIEVTDVDGCTATASVAVTVLRRVDVYVPNVFSPNGDGINDLLVVFAKENQIAQVESFKVFTRWGESVYEAANFQPNDATAGWDGTHRGKKLDVGVYAWFAVLELVNGEQVVVEGDVTLLR